MPDYSERDQMKLQTVIKDNEQESKHDLPDEADNCISPRDVELTTKQRHLLSHSELPEWLRGNELLYCHHRPPMPSFTSCFKSIFKIHSETGNIWTHLIGFIVFICVTVYMLFRPITASTPFPKDWLEKLVFGIFFAGGILCLGASWIFHTVYCHSKGVSKIFRR